MTLEYEDELVLGVLRQRSGIPSYVVKNCLWLDHKYKVKTPWVLRRLKKLEKLGLVKRVPTSYAVMISWAAI